MRRVICFLVVSLLCKASFAQDSSVVEIQVVDKQFGEPIQNVSITAVYDNGNPYQMTGTKGVAYFTIPSGKMVTFKLSHEKYFIKSNPYRKLPQKAANDTIRYSFEMEYEAIRSQRLQGCRCRCLPRNACMWKILRC